MKTVIIVILLLLVAFFLLAVVASNIRSSQITEPLRQEEIRQPFNQGG